MSSFEDRLNDSFNNASMAEIARRLDVSHPTIQNYFKGRLPAPEVLIKIAEETNVSLNWLLTGEGNKENEISKPSFEDIFEDKIKTLVNNVIDFEGFERLIRVVSREVFEQEIYRKAHAQTMFHNPVDDLADLKFKSKATQRMRQFAERFETSIKSTVYENKVWATKLIDNLNDGVMSYRDLSLHLWEIAGTNSINLEWIITGDDSKKDVKFAETDNKILNRLLRDFWNDLIDINEEQNKTDNDNYIKKLSREEREENTKNGKHLVLPIDLTKKETSQEKKTA